MRKVHHNKPLPRDGKSLAINGKIGGCSIPHRPLSKTSPPSCLGTSVRQRKSYCLRCMFIHQCQIAYITGTYPPLVNMVLGLSWALTKLNLHCSCTRRFTTDFTDHASKKTSCQSCRTSGAGGVNTNSKLSDQWHCWPSCRLQVPLQLCELYTWRGGKEAGIHQHGLTSNLYLRACWSSAIKCLFFMMRGCSMGSIPPENKFNWVSSQAFITLPTSGEFPVLSSMAIMACDNDRFFLQHCHPGRATKRYAQVISAQIRTLITSLSSRFRALSPPTACFSRSSSSNQGGTFRVVDDPLKRLNMGSRSYLRGFSIQMETAKMTGARLNRLEKKATMRVKTSKLICSVMSRVYIVGF